MKHVMNNICHVAHIINVQTRIMNHLVSVWSEYPNAFFAKDKSLFALTTSFGYIAIFFGQRRTQKKVLVGFLAKNAGEKRVLFKNKIPWMAWRRRSQKIDGLKMPVSVNFPCKVSSVHKSPKITRIHRYLFFPNSAVSISIILLNSTEVTSSFYPLMYRTVLFSSWQESQCLEPVLITQESVGS